MVKSGHMTPVIRQLTYQPPPGADLVESMSFAALRTVNGGATQRADFHVLAFVRDGRGEASADFTSHALGPRTVVWIRPGVVHRWTDIAHVTGDLILFVPTAPVTPAAQDLVANTEAAGCWPVASPAWRLITAALAHLHLESVPATVADPRTRELPRLLLSALLLRLSPPTDAGGSGSETFRRFQAAVEADFRVHHELGHYARALGWSARTLSRTCQAATGRTAKQYVTDRLLLEAKRLLAHDGLSPARCGQRLGFPDSSNFSAFFLRSTGVRPGAWQATNR